jgi:hypothetical protein
MNKNPFINALLATAYISLVVSAIFSVPETGLPEDVIILPIVMLSLFVLSVAMMGYFFVYEPVQLMIEGKQKEAIRFFFTTVLTFACTTGALILSWFLLAPILSIT